MFSDENTTLKSRWDVRDKINKVRHKYVHTHKNVLFVYNFIKDGNEMVRV